MAKYTSKCTCKHRHGQNVRAWNFYHNEDCYYYQKLKDEAAERAQTDTARRLSSYYQRKNKDKK